MFEGPIFQICKSVILLAVISVLGGFALMWVIGFWNAAAGVFALQCFGWLLWQRLVIHREEAKAVEATARALKSLEKQNVNVICPCTRNETISCPVRVGDINEFSCEMCDKKIGVAVDVNTFLKTETVNIDNELKSIDMQFEHALKESDGQYGTIHGTR